MPPLLSPVMQRQGMDLSPLTLALPELLQSLSCAVQSMPVISPELGVDTLQRGVPLGLGALDAIAVRLARLVVLGRVLRLGHCDGFRLEARR